jgi:hypothetical protein
MYIYVMYVCKQAQASMIAATAVHKERSNAIVIGRSMQAIYYIHSYTHIHNAYMHTHTHIHTTIASYLYSHIH